MSLSEFDIINTFFKSNKLTTSIVKGIGDDCAVLQIPAGKQLVMSMDTLVEGRHFPREAAPAQIATRAFCTALSDLAAMAAEPQWFTLGLSLPEANEHWLRDFSQALLPIAEDYHCVLVGGDTTQGPLTITVQVHGFVDAGQYLSRDQAGAGDSVFVSGTLGDGAAALAMLQGQQFFSEEHQRYLQGRFYQPEPQIALARQLLRYASGAIDISDGLLADLQHIATASSVDIHIFAEALPLSAACRTMEDSLARQWALCGGDDYQLAFTVPPQHLIQIENLIAKGSLSATKIGLCSSASEISQVYCTLKGDTFLPENLKRGYQHFTA